MGVDEPGFRHSLWIAFSFVTATLRDKQRRGRRVISLRGMFCVSLRAKSKLIKLSYSYGRRMAVFVMFLNNVQADASVVRFKGFGSLEVRKQCEALPGSSVWVAAVIPKTL